MSTLFASRQRNGIHCRICLSAELREVLFSQSVVCLQIAEDVFFPDLKTFQNEAVWREIMREYDWYAKSMNGMPRTIVNRQKTSIPSNLEGFLGPKGVLGAIVASKRATGSRKRPKTGRKGI